MRLKLEIDNRLIIYLPFIYLVYILANKLPSNTLPVSPVIFTCIVALALYYALYLYNINNPSESKEHYENGIHTRVKEYPTNPIVSHPLTHEDHIFAIEEKATEVTIVNTPSKDNKNVMRNGLPVIDKIISDASKEVASCNCKDVANKAIVKFLQNRRLLDKNGMLHYADAFIGDMGYSDIKLDQYIPVGAPGNGAYDTWELADFNMLNTDRWKPPTNNTRECKMGNLPLAQPLNKNTPLSLLNFDSSRTIAPPQNINIDYINDKFNKQQ